MRIETMKLQTSTHQPLIEAKTALQRPVEAKVELRRLQRVRVELVFQLRRLPHAGRLLLRRIAPLHGVARHVLAVAERARRDERVVVRQSKGDLERVGNFGDVGLMGAAGGR